MNLTAYFKLQVHLGADMGSMQFWVDDVPMDTDENLRHAIASCGQDPDAVLSRADSPEIEQALAKQVDHAKSIGIFGAPTFVVGDELFWGDDRLEDALARAGGRT